MQHNTTWASAKCLIAFLMFWSIIYKSMRLRQIFFTTLCLVLFFSQGIKAQKALSGARVGQPVPDFNVVMNDGTVMSPFSLAGKVAVIVFFSTECRDCRQELPALDYLCKEFPDVKFICISRAEGEDAILDFWKKNGLTLPFSAQKDNWVFKRFAERTIPRIYVVDRQGLIVAAYKTRVSLRKLRKAIRQTLTRTDY